MLPFVIDTIGSYVRSVLRLDKMALYIALRIPPVVTLGLQMLWLLLFLLLLSQNNAPRMGYVR